MLPYCFKCETAGLLRPKLIRFGSYYRTSDSKVVQRYRCLECKTTVSAASNSWHRYLKCRRKKKLLVHLLCSGVSQRRAAKILNLNRKTVVRQFQISSLEARFEHRLGNFLHKRAHTIEFDDLETFEHSRCKPLSVTIAVEQGSRRILGLKVSRMPAKGRLAEVSRAKYRPRADERAKGRAELFRLIEALIKKNGVIKSDSNPHYRSSVEKYFPEAKYIQFLGKRGAATGQGELKRAKYDPLFSLNHTCAKFRADINRLVRKTWCTTKRADRLEMHLTLYANYHNKNLNLNTG